MLTTYFELDQYGITVPYPPIFDEVRHNHGFVDVRGRPDLATRIPECSQSPALKALLIELSEVGSTFFTVGCDLGSHEEPEAEERNRYVAGGYLQLMHTSYADKTHDDYTFLSHVIAQRLEEQAQKYNWIVRFVPSFIDFKLDSFADIVSSLWIWFFAEAASAEAALASREIFLDSIAQNLGENELKSLFDERSNIEERLKYADAQ